MRWVFSVGYSIWEFYLKRWKIPDVRNKLRFHLRFVENAGQGSRTHSNASLENEPAPRPSLTHAGRSGWKPSHSHRVPTLLKMPQGVTTDFFYSLLSPKYSTAGNIIAKSCLATRPEFSHLGPGRNSAGTTLLRERWVLSCGQSTGFVVGSCGFSFQLCHWIILRASLVTLY